MKSFADRVCGILERDRKLVAAVRKEFDQVLAATWPEFRPSSLNHPVFAPEEGIGDDEEYGGWRIFRWETDAGVWFFLVLSFAKHFRPEFSLELLWNTADCCPFTDNSGLFDDEPWHRAKNRCRFMVPRKNGGTEAKVWKVGANPAYAPEVVVPKAIEEMKSFAEPMMKKVSKLHGKGTSCEGHQTAVLDAFQALRDAGGSGWDDIDDPEKFIEEVTGE